MSNFPYNNEKYDCTKKTFNGSPLTYTELSALADKVLYWHTNNNTGDFSESGDGFEDGVRNLSFGLVELLSDPNAIHRLMMTGEKVKENIKLVLDSDYQSETLVEVKKAINETFNK